MRHILAIGLAASVLLPTATVRAHHAFSAEFDADKPVKLEGTVSKVEWINPHIWIHIAVKGADGKTEEWMVEGGTPNTLMRRGLTTNTLKPGVQLIAAGFQAKDGSKRANGRDLLYPDGRRILLANDPGADAPGKAQ